MRAPIRRSGDLLLALGATLALGGTLVGAGVGGAARGAEAPQCKGPCPAPVLARPEAALSRAIHLTWSDLHRGIAVRYEIERRAGASGPWVGVSHIPSIGPEHYDDTGPGGRGLAPAEYEYRVRGLHGAGSTKRWSEWSPTQAATVREGCVEAGGELVGLPRVVAGDLDGDGRHTGADLVRALHECSRLGGCVLEALPVTYNDVAIVISDGDATACKENGDRTACLTDRFPNGLAIEGHGRSTVLRSPLWRSPYLPAPVLELWRRPDVRFQLRHLVLDGRKTEQRDPLPGQNNADAWRHFGLGVWNRWSDHDKPNRKGCVHDVVVRDLMTRGISLADVARWNVEYSSIEDIGCARSLTACPRITVPDAFGPGYTSTGLGIHVDWHSDDVVIRANRIRRVAKYSISLKHGQDGSETSIRRPRVQDNDIDEAGALGMFVGGIADGLFERNRIARTDSLNPQSEANAWNDTFGISCNGAAERTRFQRNRIEDMDGMAIMWSCVGRGNSISETRISGSCRRKGPRSCAPGSKPDCYMHPDIWIPDGAGGTLALVDDEIVDSRCATPLAVDLIEPDTEVLIRGGRYAAGREAVQPVRFLAANVVLERGASFSGTSLAFGPGSRGLVAPTVVVSGSGEPYRIDRQARVLVCPEQKRECEKICSDADPPAWCAAPSAPATRP